jgi:hypothetical protein
MFTAARGRLIALALAVAATAPAAASAETPVPAVSGPLPVTEESHPFGGAAFQLRPQDLRRSGYVEEEYLVSGKANVYTWPAPGPAQVRTAGAPYTTRILVRRPAKPRHGSGTVVVEMLNPSNLFDLNIGWALAHEEMMRRGDTWVGITAKPISVAALQTFDPERYGDLSFANPLPLSDPRNCTTVAADSSRTTENGLIWDINSQVGAWLESRARSNPLRGSVDRLLGFGYSQTGGYLNTYVNAIHPLAHVFDGYLIEVAGGAFVGLVPINQCEPAPPVTDPRRQIVNAGVPVMRAMSQSDYLIGIASRRPDSDVPGDRYRHYEVAGAGHASPDELYYSARPEDIVKAGRSVPPLSCNEGPRSRLSMSHATMAFLRNLDAWVRWKVPPPHAAPIQVEDGAPVLDEFGNVVGGVRSPYVDVPTATWFGSATGASFCFIAGWERPFDEATLRALYPTHGNYVGKVIRSTAQLVKARFLTPIDGLKIIREAARAEVP